MNEVRLIGTLGADPEVKYLNSGDCMTSFSIALNERNNKTNETFTTWQKIISFRHVADRAQHLKKGDRVFVSGKIQTRKWQEKLITEVSAFIVEKIDKYKSPSPTKNPIGTPVKVNFKPGENDDIPF